MHCGTILRDFGSTQMTCVSSFPNSKRNGSDSKDSDPIDCCVLSMFTLSSLLVCRKKKCNNIIFLFIARFVALFAYLDGDQIKYF